MDTLNESQWVARMFVKVGTNVVERLFVDWDTCGYGWCVNEDVAILGDLVDVLHIFTFIIDVE